MSLSFHKHVSNLEYRVPIVQETNPQSRTNRIKYRYGEPDEEPT